MSVSKDKRNYWYAKLDEVLHLWYQNAGQGYYNLVMNELCVLARKETRKELLLIKLLLQLEQLLFRVSLTVFSLKRDRLSPKQKCIKIEYHWSFRNLSTLLNQCFEVNGTF